MAPRAVLRYGPGFFLRQRGHDREQQLALAVEGPDIFLLKIALDVVLLQGADGRQAVYGVPGETADGLGDDQIDLPGQRIRHHAFEALALFRVGAGDAFVGVDPSELPIVPALNVVGVVVHLRLVARQLFFLIGTDTSIGGHPALLGAVDRSRREPAERGRYTMYLSVYEHNGIDSIVFFKQGELLIGEDRIVDLGGNQKKHEKAPQGEIKIIPAGTIVVNSNIRRWEHSSFNIFHECYHYDQHYLFYFLQELSSNDLRQVPVKEVCLEKDEVVKDSIYFMEKQANRGAMGLMMPVTHTRQLILDEYGKVREYRHAGDRYDAAGTNIRKKLELPDFRIRARMIQLGFVEAKGALNYIDGDKIEPFAFDPNAWRESDITYIINERLALKLAVRNEALHELLDSGKYVYADGHIIRNSPKFVQWVGLGRKRLLTDYANAHVDKCCLRFVQKYVQKTVGRYVYGRMYFDADYLKQTDFYLRDIINEQQVDEIDAMDMFIDAFPRDFKEVVNMLKKMNHLSNAKLAELFQMDDSTFARILDDPRRYRNEDFLTLLCLCFKLPDWISSLLFKRARFQLDDGDRRHRAILHILRVQSNDGIEAANDFLKSHGMAPLSLNI